MDFHIIRCPLQHSKRIMLGTFRTIKCHFGGFLNPTPHFIPHLFYLRLMFLVSVRSPLHLKHLKPFGTLATIKPHLAPSLYQCVYVCVYFLYLFLSHAHTHLHTHIRTRTYIHIYNRVLGIIIPFSIVQYCKENPLASLPNDTAWNVKCAPF